jgi:hypothetical protein
MQLDANRCRPIRLNCELDGTIVGTFLGAHLGMQLDASRCRPVRLNCELDGTIVGTFLGAHRHRRRLADAPHVDVDTQETPWRWGLSGVANAPSVVVGAARAVGIVFAMRADMGAGDEQARRASGTRRRVPGRKSAPYTQVKR